jgi:hypothetical protein
MTTESYGCTDIETSDIYKGRAKFTHRNWTKQRDVRWRHSETKLTSFLCGVHVKLVLQAAGCAKFSALITCQLAGAEKVTRPRLQVEATHGRNVLGRGRQRLAGKEARKERREMRRIQGRGEARKQGRKGGRGEGIMEEIKAARKKRSLETRKEGRWEERKEARKK